MDGHADMQRYARQTILPEIGISGQEKLRSARVLCIGAGGLGSPALLYLVAAGIGHIGIVDGDAVDLSNLQRQILFTESQIGENKARAAQAQLQARNSGCEITAYPYMLDAKHAADLFKAYDVVIDATDNFAAKFLINDSAVQTQTPWVYGSILGFEGQMASFDPAQKDAPCYRCLFPHPPHEAVLTCAEAGVIGAVAGLVGSAQALAAIKIILRNPALGAIGDDLLQIDVRTCQTRQIALVKDPECTACSGHKAAPLAAKDKTMLTSHGKAQSDQISAEGLMELLASGASDIQLLDVRELDEWEAGYIEGADHCPLSLLLQGFRPDNLKKDATLVLYCRSGVRSMQAFHILKSQGYADLRNMMGGYEAWRRLSVRAA